MKMYAWCGFGLFGYAILAAPIPRAARNVFTTDALYEGGTPGRVELQSIRFGFHKKTQMERWVIDFRTDKGTASKAPVFQLRYEPEKRALIGGMEGVEKPARFVWQLQQISKNLLRNDELTRLTAKSRFIKNIVVYPFVEDGDMALEFVMSQNVKFEAHQPLQNEGRLVLDLKSVE